MYAFCCGLGSNVSTRLKQTSFIFGSSINLLYFNQVIRRTDTLTAIELYYTTRYFLSLEIICENHQTFLLYLKLHFYHYIWQFNKFIILQSGNSKSLHNQILLIIRDCLQESSNISVLLEAYFLSSEIVCENHHILIVRLET